jgi:SpoVK/Ycf46/Vps4 family AAA+-type ATPase
MSDEELLICTYQVPGFTLTTKRWGLFNASDLRPVEYNKEAFMSLVLPEHFKKTLASLVKLQEANSPQFDDLIEGKGKGLIVLLHGPPGVGKTFTAGQST